MIRCIILSIITLLLSITPLQAQKRMAENIFAGSHNDSTDSLRMMQYYPEGDYFVCVNGKNRYTRALYGGYTDWRLETSDVPVFAIYKKNNCRSIILSVISKGDTLRLDNVDYCKSWYGRGKRIYELRDSRWDNKPLLITAMANHNTEEAVFYIQPGQSWTDSLMWQTTSFADMRMQVEIMGIAREKLARNGDIGADPPGVFEPAPDRKGYKSLTYDINAASVLTITDVDVLSVETCDPDCQGWLSAVAKMEDISQYYEDLTSRVTFITPDPYVNSIGGALTLAADGVWDGTTWLHGAVGWRMPLAGWRAGYLGDVLGWNDRALSHFNAYAASQVTSVPPVLPHPSQDVKQNLARAAKKWGTQMYSDGYICRNPYRNNQMHHYDMNLNYIDELLWHFQYDADTSYMRKMWPVVERHLAWEKRNFDPDGDHLYDAYCCIWASDALYYSGGAVTHSSAYNYRANRVAAIIADKLGVPSERYHKEADAIKRAMNDGLWLNDGHWAEYRDLMGLQRVHENAALWSVYTPIDCGAGSPQQYYNATRYVDSKIPHLPVRWQSNPLYDRIFDCGADTLYTISTSNWMPYSWSINNVASAEVMNTALAFFNSGRSNAGFNLMKANIMDQMYLGSSPANFGQVSYYDAARGECYRDFGDNVGVSARTLLQGLFGIQPDALNGKCVIRPGFPAEWDSASVKTPYLSYTYRKRGDKAELTIEQNFSKPLDIIVRVNKGEGLYSDYHATSERIQTVTVDIPDGGELYTASSIKADSHDADRLGLSEPNVDAPFRMIDISKDFNAEVDDIYKNEYLSPRPPYTTLQMPLQGIGEWCHPKYCPEINDSVFRTLISEESFIVAGVPFRTPKAGMNIAYTSLWDNYPDSIVLKMKGKAERAYLLMAGSTNHMQSRIDNALVIASYSDGSTDTLRLINPYNWCPIEQDYYVDGKAFATIHPRPYRICLSTGTVSRDLGKVLDIKGVYGREIPGGALQMLSMPLNPQKRLRSMTLRTLSNDVVVGLMAVTLQ